MLPMLPMLPLTPPELYTTLAGVENMRSCFERHDRGSSDRPCWWGRGAQLLFPLVWNSERQHEAFCSA